MLKRLLPLSKAVCLIVLAMSYAVNALYGQSAYFGDEPVVWPIGKPMDMPKELSNYGNSDLVIISEKTEFFFYSTSNQKIKKSILFKINSAKGLSMLQSFKLPESFDKANDENYYRQGRRSRIDIPYISEYHIDKFAARKAVSKVWLDLKFKYRVDKIRWIKPSGEFVGDDINVFQLQNIAVGDVIEIYYEAFFTSNYGSNLFYFNGGSPKISCEYDFIYKVDSRFADYSFILPVQIKDSLVHRSAEEFKEYSIITYKIKLNNLTNINYPVNSFVGNTMPHVYADFRYYTIVKGSYPTDGNRLYEYDRYRPKNFEWVVFNDTVNNFTKIYDKQFASVRKFITKMPPVTDDSTKLLFFRALCDTINSYQYISSNDLFYNKSALYDLYSGDQLLKRRVIQHSIGKLTRDILNENKLFYYAVNIEDNRLGEHSLKQRYHYAYENSLVGTPYNKTFIYFIPGTEGVKYHLNELPFYNEGVIAAMTARNFQEDAKDKESQVFKFIKTHSSNYKENTRVESATFKIVLDSLKASVSIKESLSGQFSTVLRHYYLNEYIDSTIAPYYFRKCTDKPLTKEAKIKLTSNISEFPFRYNFNCAEKLSMTSSKNINMSNWFSFLLSQKTINETPNFDYYFDFTYTDSYNFLLDLNSGIEVTNLEGFDKKIDNDYFFLESTIRKNSDSNYLVKVNYSVKQKKVPIDKMNLLTEMLKALDELNNYSLQIKA